MDLIGKAFACEDQIIYVEDIVPHRFSSEMLFNCSFVAKTTFSYSVGHTSIFKPAIKNFPKEVDPSIVFKIKSMLNLNFIACNSILERAKRVKSSRHYIVVEKDYMCLQGLEYIEVLKESVHLEPIENWFFAPSYEHILKKDYSKVRNKVKELKKEIDRIWADAV